MSDLISRSELIDYLDKERKQIPIDSEKYNIDSNVVDGMVSALQAFENKAKEVESAYSVDKVVEELESNSFITVKNEEVKTKRKDIPSYISVEKEVVLLKDAIEIVKQGGVGTETETIRDKAVKWYNNSSKRVPYEFIDYVEGRREIGVSDDVCEWKYNDTEYYWESSCDHLHIFMSDGPKENEYEFCPYCGKKIKVVE